MKFLIRSLIIILLPLVQNTAIYAMEAEQPGSIAVFDFLDPQSQLIYVVRDYVNGVLKEEHLSQLRSDQVASLKNQLNSLSSADSATKQKFIQENDLKLDEKSLQAQLMQLAKTLERLSPKTGGIQLTPGGASFDFDPSMLSNLPIFSQEPALSEDEELQRALELSRQEYEK